MPYTENVVQFGARNLYLAVYDKTAGTYGTPFRVPGLQSVGVASGSGSETNIYGDDTTLYSQSAGSNAKTLTVQVAKFNDEFHEKALGQTANANGGFYESPDDIAAPVALMFQMGGENGGRRVCYFQSKFGVPTYTAGTNTDTITEDPETAEATCTPIEIDGKRYMSFSLQEGQEGYDTFFDAVPVPASSDNGGE